MREIPIVEDAGHDAESSFLRVFNDIIKFCCVFLVQGVVEIHAGLPVHCSGVFGAVKGEKLVAVEPNTEIVSFTGELLEILFVIVDAVRLFVGPEIGGIVPSNIRTDGEIGLRLSPPVDKNVAFQVFGVGQFDEAFGVFRLAIKS